jgi:hypothetical protein
MLRSDTVRHRSAAPVEARHFAPSAEEQSTMLQTSQGAGSGLAVEYSAMVHEMAEALQAITGYVGAARRIATRTIEDSASPLLGILEKAENQVLRANRTFRNAHNQFVQTPEDA